MSLNHAIELVPQKNDPEVLLHPKATLCGPVLDHKFVCSGEMAPLSDGRVLMTYAGLSKNVHQLKIGEASVSVITSDSELSQEGWSSKREIIHHPECKACGPSLLRDKKGTLWLFYLGFIQHEEWQNGEPGNETVSDVWCARSDDDGKTWDDRKMIFKGYCGATRGAIQHPCGALVVPISYLVRNPGRYVSTCVVSKDDGKTWQLGEGIDIGQQGDHAGAVEPTVVELSDGRLWLLIRTNLGYFMDSYSSDCGMTWTKPVESALRSPSSPGFLHRLSSGRICLIWNNTMDRAERIEAVEGEIFSGSDIDMSVRDTLSVALTDDDGASWTKPVEVAKSLQLSYPKILEVSPGKLLFGCQWVSQDWDRLRPVYFKMNEKDLLG